VLELTVDRCWDVVLTFEKIPLIKNEKRFSFFPLYTLQKFNVENQNVFRREKGMVLRRCQPRQSIIHANCQTNRKVGFLDLLLVINSAIRD